MEQKAKKDFSKGKIYMIRCNKTQLIYIGSTTKQYLSQRMGSHVACYKRWTNGKGSYTSSFEIIKNGDYVILLIESHPCKSSDELRMREQYYIDLNKGCMNKCRAYTTVEHKLEYKKEYYEVNKEAINERAKEYYEANKEAINERTKEYYEANKEKIVEYREENKEKKAEYQKEYYEVNKEAINERVKEYREANKEAISKQKKEYREANKEAIAEHKKEYYEVNKEAILEQRNAKITCSCGAVISHCKKAIHERTKKHISQTTLS